MNANMKDIFSFRLANVFNFYRFTNAQFKSPENQEVSV